MINRLNVPRNYISDVKQEMTPSHQYNWAEYGKPYYYANYEDNWGVDKFQYRFELKLVIDVKDTRDYVFIRYLQHEGLDFISKNGFPVKEFEYVMEQGYTKLPFLLRHENPKVAEIADMLCKFFSERDKKNVEKNNSNT